MRLRADSAAPDGEQSLAATRITLRPHDPGTGEEIEKREVVKGYEYSRGQFLTFTAAELKALDVESSKVVDLEKFVAGSDIDPIYFDSPYYLYPDGPIAFEALRVIGAAMAQAGVVGLGRLTLSRRERMVMVEPRDTGMALFTLRAAGEVRAPQFGSAEGDLDAEMVAIAGTIIRQRTGNSPLAPTAMVPAMVVVSTPMGTSKIWISMCKAFASGLARTGRIPCALAISLP
jgi:DNA end-binding protein Ku